MSARPRPVNLALPVGFLAVRGPGALWHLVPARTGRRRGLCGTRVSGPHEGLDGVIRRTCGRCAVLHAGEKGDERATTN